MRWQDRARQEFDLVLDRIGEAFDAERTAGEHAAAETARNQIAESLNQGLRRVRQASTLEDAAGLAHELSVPFASRCALFFFQEGQAEAKAVRGFGLLPLVFSPDEGAAFRAVVETKDPVIAVGSEAEISPTLAARAGTDGMERVYLFPLTVRSQVRAILFAAGMVAFAPMELLAGLAAMQMEALTPAVPPKRADLLDIQGAEADQKASHSRNGLSWNDLTPDLQALHLRAQREARLRVATMRLEHGEALRRGVAQSNIYGTLRDPIDNARAAFRKGYIEASPSMVDYLYLELVRGLAQDNDKLLGASFPGPLV